MSDSQRYKIAADSYTATVTSLTNASKAGYLTLSDMEKIAPIEQEAYRTLKAMREALVEGKKLDFAWYSQAFQKAIDNLIVYQAKADAEKALKEGERR